MGDSILLEIQELINPVICKEDVEISNNIYLRIGQDFRLSKDQIINWVGKCIKDLAGMLYSILNNSPVCYLIKSLEFNHADFQEEGLYYATQEWFSKYYKIEIKPANIFFSKEKNIYLFPDLYPHKPTD